MLGLLARTHTQKFSHLAKQPTSSLGGLLGKKTKEEPKQLHDEFDKMPVAEVIPLTQVTKYNLRRYNRRRHELLMRVPEPIIPEEKKEEHEKITDAMKMREHWLTGNLSVSLFWEDMFNLIVRINQLYSFIFITYYEFWPSKYRIQMTEWFSMWILSF